MGVGSFPSRGRHIYLPCSADPFLSCLPAPWRAFLAASITGVAGGRWTLVHTMLAFTGMGGLWLWDEFEPGDQRQKFLNRSGASSNRSGASSVQRIARS
jgi:hypothetical protein